MWAYTQCRRPDKESDLLKLEWQTVMTWAAWRPTSDRDPHKPSLHPYFSLKINVPISWSMSFQNCLAVVDIWWDSCLFYTWRSNLGREAPYKTDGFYMCFQYERWQAGERASLGSALVFQSWCVPCSGNLIVPEEFINTQQGRSSAYVTDWTCCHCSMRNYGDCLSSAFKSRESLKDTHSLLHYGWGLPASWSQRSP